MTYNKIKKICKNTKKLNNNSCSLCELNHKGKCEVIDNDGNTPDTIEWRSRFKSNKIEKELKKAGVSDEICDKIISMHHTEDDDALIAYLQELEDNGINYFQELKQSLVDYEEKEEQIYELQQEQENDGEITTTIITDLHHHFGVEY